jgi:hypothetical protein
LDTTFAIWANGAPISQFATINDVEEKSVKECIKGCAILGRIWQMLKCKPLCKRGDVRIGTHRITILVFRK